MTAVLSPFGSKGAAVPVIFPSGDETGNTDTIAINRGLANGGSVQLAPAPNTAPYWINAPITPTSQSRLWGTQWWSASSFDGVGGVPGGSVIALVPGFIGAAAIDMTNTTSTYATGVDLAGFTVNGQNYTGDSHGLLVDGGWSSCFMRGVEIFRFRGDCVHMTFDDSSGKVPDDWLFSECKFSGANGNGVFTADVPDTWWIACESSEHGADAWNMSLGINTHMIACKAENSNGNGYHLGGLGNGQQFFMTNCTTHLNNLNGFLFDNSSGIGGQGTYMLTGCAAADDNLSATSGLAGYLADGCLSLIMATGCQTTGPNYTYGAAEIGTSYGMSLIGASLMGSTSATFDDGSNTHALSNLVPVPF